MIICQGGLLEQAHSMAGTGAWWLPSGAVHSFVRDELLILGVVTLDVELVLLVEELLGLPQDVLQLGQLQEVLLQSLRVLVHLRKSRN